MEQHHISWQHFDSSGAQCSNAATLQLNSSGQRAASRTATRGLQFAALFLLCTALTLRCRPPALCDAQGIKNVPNRLRIVVQRKRNEDDEDSEEMFSLVTLAEDQNTKKGVVVLEA